MSEIIYDQKVYIHGPLSNGTYVGYPNMSIQLKVYKEVRSGNTLSIDVEASLNKIDSGGTYFGYNLTVSARLDNGSPVQLFSKPYSDRSWESGVYVSGRKTLQSTNANTSAYLYILFESRNTGYADDCPCHKGQVDTVATIHLQNLTPANHIITFHPNNGIDGTNNVSVSPGGQFPSYKPANVLPGHYWAGWNGDTSSPVNNSRTLTGKWSANQHTVVYDLNGGSAPSGASFSGFTKCYGSVQTITSYVPVKYLTATLDPGDDGKISTSSIGETVDIKKSAKFLGWEAVLNGSVICNLQPSETYGLDVDNGSTVTLRAKWGDASIVLPTPENGTSLFTGWYTELGVNVSKWGTKLTISEDVKLYARWAPTNIFIRISGKWEPWFPEDTTEGNVNMVYLRKNNSWVKQAQIKRYDGKSWVDL